MKINIVILAIFSVFLLLALGCSSDSGSSDGISQAVPASGHEDVEEMVVDDHSDEEEHADEIVEVHSEDEENTGEVVEIEMTAKQWEFTPSTIEVNQGDNVELHIESVDVAHGFALPDFGINEKLEPGKDVHIEFVADKAGTFTFACSVPCGGGHTGMKGKLIVN